MECLKVGSACSLETLCGMEIGPFHILTYLDMKAKAYFFVSMISRTLHDVMGNEPKTLRT